MGEISGIFEPASYKAGRVKGLNWGVGYGFIVGTINTLLWLNIFGVI